MIYTPVPKIWHYRFAFFPKNIGGNWIWLEKYAWRQVDVIQDGEVILDIREWSHPTLGTFKGTRCFIGTYVSSVRWEPLLGSEQK